MSRFAVLLFAVFLALGTPAVAQAALMVSISESNGPSTTWTFSGSGTVSQFNFVPAANSLSVTPSPAIFQNLESSDSGGHTPVGTVEVFINNTSVGTIDLIRIHNPNLWDFSLNNSVLYNVGDTISWSGSFVLNNFSGTKVIDNVTGLPVDPGTIGPVITSSTASPLVLIPEPATLAVFGLMTVGGTGCVRRRLKAAPPAG